MLLKAHTYPISLILLCSRYQIPGGRLNSKSTLGQNIRTGAIAYLKLQTNNTCSQSIKINP